MGPDITRSDDPLVGLVLDGRYQILRPLAKGGMGAIYLALQLNVERQVAVKVMRPEAAADPELAARFRAEAKIISQLRHPNTVKLFDYGVTPQRLFYLVTELLAGESLQERLERGPLHVAETLHLLEQVTLALEEAHSLGIVHRDLKPANLFIEKVGTREIIKVLDFGIAKATQAPDSLQTAGGVLVGTPAYLSPEQAQNLPLDGRSDYYSLGVVAFRCLSGRLPFEGDAFAQIAAHALEAPPTLELSETIPEGVRSLISRLMNKDPKLRPQNAVELLGTLQELKNPSAAPTPKKPAWRSPLLVALLCLAAAATWGLLGQKKDSLPPETIGGASDAGLAQATDLGVKLDSSLPIVISTTVSETISEKPQPTAKEPLEPRMISAEGWPESAPIDQVWTQLSPVLQQCYQRLRLSPRQLELRFGISAKGRWIRLSPKGEDAQKLRNCLYLGLKTPPAWPAPLPGITAILKARVGNSTTSVDTPGIGP